MAQVGYTPISLYYSPTAGHVPVAANLVPGELGLNIVDGKLYYKDGNGVVQLLAWGFTAQGNAYNLIGGTTGSLPYQTTSGATTFLAPGTNGQTLEIVNGLPTWVTATADTPNSLTGNASGTGAAPGATFNGAAPVTFSYNTFGAAAADGTNATGTWPISITGTTAGIAGGAANQVVYQSAPGVTAFATAPTAAGTVLTWNGTGFTWAAPSSGTTAFSLTANNSGTGAASGASFNGSAAITISYNTVGAPSTSGAGATGTWPISISGSAASSSGITGGAANELVFQTGPSTTGFVVPPNTSGTVLTWNGTSFVWSTPSGSTTNAATFNSSGSGAISGTTFDGSAAKTISYNTIGAAAIDGSNATGTWPVSITGNAATATTAGNGVPSGGTAGQVLEIVCGVPAWATPAGSGTTTNAVTFNNTGTGAAAGTTFNGSAAVCVSYNTILPSGATANQVLTTNSSGVVVWTTPAGVTGNACGTSISIACATGTANQNTGAIAIGKNAGVAPCCSQRQSNCGVAIGTNTGFGTGVSIGANAKSGACGVAVGVCVGSSMGANSVAIGFNSGKCGQSCAAIAIGQNAGHTNQGLAAVAISTAAGNSNQGLAAVAIGEFSGQTSQGACAVAVGTGSGQTSQGACAVAVGAGSGQTSQGTHAVSIGNAAGATNQGARAIAIGPWAGKTCQAAGSIAINALDFSPCYGMGAWAVTNPGFYVAPVRACVPTCSPTVAYYNNITKEFTFGAAPLPAPGTSGQVLTTNACNAVVWATPANPIGGNPAGNSIAISTGKGCTSQGGQAIALGCGAATTNQSSQAIAIGYNAAGSNQGGNAIAIGWSAALSCQGQDSIAIGNGAGGVSQGNQSIALGYNAGSAGIIANAIEINATGATVARTNAGFYVAPVRACVASASGTILTYCATSNEIAVTIPIFPVLDPSTISTPVTGMAVINSNTNAFTYYNGSAWV